MLKADKNLIVVGEYRRGYYFTKGYDKLKQILFEENDCSNIENLYIENEEGDFTLNEEVYNELDLDDIDTDIQQVLGCDEIVEHLTDNEPDEDGNYFCRVRINGGWDYVKIPSIFFEEE